MKYRISANSLSFIVQKQVITKEKKIWVGCHWFGTAESLGKFLVEFKTRCYVSLGTDIIEAINKAHKEVVEMLSTGEMEFDLKFKKNSENEADGKDGG